MSRRAPKGEYFETDNGNKVSRRSNLIGTHNIMLGGRTVIQPEVMIRADLVRTVAPPPLPPPAVSESASAPPATSTSSVQPGGAATQSTTTVTAAAQQQKPRATVVASNTAVSVGKYSFLARGCVLRPSGRINKGQYSHFPLRIGEHVLVGEGSVIRAAQIGSHVRIGRNVVIGDHAVVRDYVVVLDGSVLPDNMVVPNFSIVAGRPAKVVGEVPEGMTDSFDGSDLYKLVGNQFSAQALGLAGNRV